MRNMLAAILLDTQYGLLPQVGHWIDMATGLKFDTRRYIYQWILAKIYLLRHHSSTFINEDWLQRPRIWRHVYIFIMSLYYYEITIIVSSILHLSERVLRTAVVDPRRLEPRLSQQSQPLWPLFLFASPNYCLLESTCLHVCVWRAVHT